jgi:small-conductance mechanosensitive channel
MAEIAFLDQTFLSNTVGQWLFATAAFVGLTIALRSVTSFVIRRLGGLTDLTRTDLDDLLIELLKKTRGLFIVLLSAWAASLGLALEEPHRDLFIRILWVGLLVQGGLWATGLVNYFLRRYRRKQAEEDPGMATALGAVGFVAKAGLWAVFALLILQNLGVEITPLLAGVSVGGIAVALAVQNVLGDLLSSLSIILDKPFVIGDFIVVGEFSGNVEHVGLKSTHIRSVSGEQLVFSNSDLLSSRIRNYKRMQERRAVFTVGVTYSTPPEVLEAIPSMIREIVEEHETTRFGRSHFKSFGGYSLDVETVFFMTNPDFDTYMDVQQAINLAIYRKFGAEGIEFACPTQTLHVAGHKNSLRD